MNISNAALLGLKTDLDIVNGTKYSTALTIFFVPYIIAEVYSVYLSRDVYNSDDYVAGAVEYSSEKVEASCVVVGLHGTVWVHHDDAGEIIPFFFTGLH